jgi:hypothetical protein
VATKADVDIAFPQLDHADSVVDDITAPLITDCYNVGWFVSRQCIVQNRVFTAFS